MLQRVARAPARALLLLLRLLGFGWRERDLRRRFYSPRFRTMYGRFRRTIYQYARPGHVVLDAGCGSGRDFQPRLQRRVARVVGVDRRKECRDNPNVDQFILADLCELDLPDATHDLVILCHVAEHLSRAEAPRAFRQLCRVLRPGGRLLLLTPSRWHYVSVIARLTPHPLHELFNGWRGIDKHEVIPTRYQANTASCLRALAEGAGLTVERLDRFETHPEYLAFHFLAYAIGVAYERVVNRFEVLAPLRVNLMLVAQRRAYVVDTAP